MRDLLIRGRVQTALELEPDVDAAHIGVAVQEGVVTLLGHVGSDVELRRAARVAQRVRDVGALALEIEVRPPGEKSASDAGIAARVRRSLAWSVGAPAGAIAITVRHGCVELSGEVDCDHQRRVVGDAVGHLSGVAAIEVEVWGRTVTLKGRVDTIHERDVARRAAWAVRGVEHVNDQLIVGG